MKVFLPVDLLTATGVKSEKKNRLRVAHLPLRTLAGRAVLIRGEEYRAVVRRNVLRAVFATHRSGPRFSRLSGECGLVATRPLMRSTLSRVGAYSGLFTSISCPWEQLPALHRSLSLL